MERYRPTARLNPVNQDIQTYVQEGNVSPFTPHFDIHLHASTHQEWYQISQWETPLLTQMKSSNRNLTPPAVS